jgi:hypothetical protein
MGWRTIHHSQTLAALPRTPLLAGPRSLMEEHAISLATRYTRGAGCEGEESGMWMSRGEKRAALGR